MSKNGKNLCIALFLSALGVLLPYVCAGMRLEPVLLTHHIPVLLAGFLLPMNFAVGCAVMVVILNTIFLGVPEIYPGFPIELVHLIALAAISHMMYNVSRMKLYPALLLTIICGWGLQFCATSIISWIMDGINAFAYTFEEIKLGWPGMVMQLIVVPPVVKLVEWWRGKRSDIQKEAR